MSVPSTIRHTGILTAESTGLSVFGAGPVDTSFGATYATKKVGQIDVEDALSVPVELDLENVVKVRVLMLSVTGNTCKVLLTSAAGTDQVLFLASGGLHLQHLPSVGAEITAIQFEGDGSTVSYFIAGDAS